MEERIWGQKVDIIDCTTLRNTFAKVGRAFFCQSDTKTCVQRYADKSMMPEASTGTEPFQN